MAPTISLAASATTSTGNSYTAATASKTETSTSNTSSLSPEARKGNGFDADRDKNQDHLSLKDRGMEQIQTLEKIAQFLQELNSLAPHEQMARFAQMQGKINGLVETLIQSSGVALARNLLPKELSLEAIKPNGLDRKALQAEHSGHAELVGVGSRLSDNGLVEFTAPTLAVNIEQLSLLRERYAGHPQAQDVLIQLLDRMVKLQQELAQSSWNNANGQTSQTFSSSSNASSALIA